MPPSLRYPAPVFCQGACSKQQLRLSPGLTWLSACTQGEGLTECGLTAENRLGTHVKLDFARQISCQLSAICGKGGQPRLAILMVNRIDWLLYKYKKSIIQFSMELIRKKRDLSRFQDEKISIRLVFRSLNQSLTGVAGFPSGDTGSSRYTPPSPLLPIISKHQYPILHQSRSFLLIPRLVIQDC